MLGKLFNSIGGHREREQAALLELKARYHAFRIFLENNGRALELIVDIDGRLADNRDSAIASLVEELNGVCSELVDGLNLLSDNRYAKLYRTQGVLAAHVQKQLGKFGRNVQTNPLYCVGLDDPEAADVSLFGNKAATLARLKSLGLPLPDGFACSVHGCRDFLGAGGMSNEIRSRLRKVDQGKADLVSVADDIRGMIFQEPLPGSLSRALEESYVQLQNKSDGDKGNFFISVRSSGVSEDGRDFSFSGQYSSILNVESVDALFHAYRGVIASGFGSRVISYRKNAGLPVVDLDLAVLCQVMFEPDCAGVLFSHDPSQPDNGRMVISAVPGLGSSAVNGSAPADIYRPPRLQQVCDAALTAVADGPGDFDREDVDEDQLMAGAVIPHKTSYEVTASKGGVQKKGFPQERADLPLLSPGSLRELVHLGSVIESLEKLPQDIEWAWSASAGFVILQARPLRLSSVDEAQRFSLPSIATPLIRGTCASAGKVVGQVKPVHSADELSIVYEAIKNEEAHPLILVLPQSIVDAAPLIQHCDGLIVDIGNPTDHLSCVARESGIPVITGAENALACLADGDWIILDADKGAISRAPDSVKAKAIETAKGQKAKRRARPLVEANTSVQHDCNQRERLREMIVPLNLTDKYGATFSIQECQSIHDLVRYTHEMAVLSMFHAGDRVMEEAGALLHPIDIGIPFSFLVIDVGGGTRQPAGRSFLSHLSPQRLLRKDDILSIPLIALCEGLTNPEISWHSIPDSGAISGILSRTMLDSRGKRPAGSFNYALTARDYLNLNIRMEFHFAMLDTVCGRDNRANYIRFRFKGGGAGEERSRRRAVFLQQVLEKNAFYTVMEGDLITASLMGAAKETVYQRLVMLGHLLGYSRFLDGVMSDDVVPLRLADQFLAGDFSAREILPEED